MMIYRRTLFAILFILSLSLLAPLAPLFAQTDNVHIGGVTVSPAKVDRQIAPGGSYRYELVITNTSSQAHTFAISVEDFTASQDPYAPVQLLGDNRSVSSSLKDFMFVSTPTITLLPGESGPLLVTVRLPDTIRPGGYYGSVLVSTQPRDDLAINGAITISRVASLFFVTVPGEVNYSTDLTSFHVEPRGVLLGQTPRFEYRIKNRGDIHVIPYGGITITKNSGKIIESMAIEPFFVLPKSERILGVDWGGSKLPSGHLVATVELNKGYSNEVMSMSAPFWIVSWREIAISVGILLLIIIFITKLISYYATPRSSRI